MWVRSTDYISVCYKIEFREPTSSRRTTRRVKHRKTVNEQIVKMGNYATPRNSKNVSQAPLLLQLEKGRFHISHVDWLRQCDQNSVKWRLFNKASVNELAEPLSVPFSIFHASKTRNRETFTNLRTMDFLMMSSDSILRWLSSIHLSWPETLRPEAHQSCSRKINELD